MSDWMIFAERITTEMERQQLSIRQLADKMGMTTTTVSRYAKGERVPRANEVVRAADALGVTCDYLIGLSDNPHRINEQGEMISRQAVKEWLAKWEGYLDADMIARMQYRVIDIPNAQPEPQWIPCSERLPENDNEVLITVWDAEDDYVEVYKGFYQDHEWWSQWCHGCLKIKDEPCGENIVIAWMPLPEPWEGEQG